MVRTGEEWDKKIQEAKDYLNSLKELVNRLTDPDKLLQIQREITSQYGDVIRAPGIREIALPMLSQIGKQYEYYKKNPVAQPDGEDENGRNSSRYNGRNNAEEQDYTITAPDNMQTSQTAADAQEATRLLDILVNAKPDMQGRLTPEQQTASDQYIALAKKYGVDQSDGITRAVVDKITQQATQEQNLASVRNAPQPPQPSPSAPKTEVPTYDFKKTPEMQKYEDIINARLVKAPEFTPEMVTQWQAKLDEMQAPFEEQAAERLRGEFSAASPLSYGSGNQMTATRELIREQAANKAAMALSLGKEEYANKKSDYENALTQSMALQQYYTQVKNMKTDQERQDAWTNIQRQWGLEDVAGARAYQTATSATERQRQLEDQKTQDEQYWERLMEQEDFTLSQQDRQNKQQMQQLLTTRGWTLADALTARNQALTDYETQKRDYADIAVAGKPEEQPWWQQFLAPIAQGAGYAIGGPAGTAVAGGIASFFGPKQKQPAYTGPLARPASQPYNYNVPYTPYYNSYLG